MYFVLRIYTSGFTASCVFQTSNFDDALAYAKIMERTNENSKYIVTKEA